MSKKQKKSASDNPENPKKKELSRHFIQRLAEAEEYKIKGNHEKAIKIAQSLLKKDPECIDAAEEVADNLLSLDMYDEAEDTSRFILKHKKDSYIANYILGFLCLIEGNDVDAVPLLRIANKNRGNNPEILRCLGWSMFHAGEKLKGILTLERALNIRNDDPLILCDLGVCMLKEGAYPKAIQLFEKALALDPQNARAIDCLEAAKEVQFQIEEAKKTKNTGGMISNPLQFTEPFAHMPSHPAKPAG